MLSTVGEDYLEIQKTRSHNSRREIHSDSSLDSVIIPRKRRLVKVSNYLCSEDDPVSGDSSSDLDAERESDLEGSSLDQYQSDSFCVDGACAAEDDVIDIKSTLRVINQMEQCPPRIHVHYDDSEISDFSESSSEDFSEESSAKAAMLCCDICNKFKIESEEFSVIALKKALHHEPLVCIECNAPWFARPADTTLGRNSIWVGSVDS